MSPISQPYANTHCRHRLLLYSFVMSSCPFVLALDEKVKCCRNKLQCVAVLSKAHMSAQADWTLHQVGSAGFSCKGSCTESCTAPGKTALGHAKTWAVWILSKASDELAQLGIHDAAANGNGTQTRWAQRKFPSSSMSQVSACFARSMFVQSCPSLGTQLSAASRCFVHKATAFFRASFANSSHSWSNTGPLSFDVSSSVL